jgi:hypothetical protein
MRAEFNRIYWNMLNSDTIADGEYYVIHADHIHDFKKAIDNYLEEKHKIEQIDQNDLDWIYLYTKKEMVEEIKHNVELLRRKVNEIVYALNKGDVK